MSGTQKEHTLEEFAELAKEKFGDRVVFSLIQFSNESDVELVKEGWTSKMIKDLQNYKQIWIVNGKCPSCDAELGGLFGSFDWGIVRGYGTCVECGKVSIKLYHYFEDGDARKLVQAYALVGF